jgi:hypothetical protein
MFGLSVSLHVNAPFRKAHDANGYRSTDSSVLATRPTDIQRFFLYRKGFCEATIVKLQVHTTQPSPQFFYPTCIFLDVVN